MLKCEGYKMFYGTCEIKGVDRTFTRKGTWLYKPNTDTWYCDSWYSYPAEVVTVVEDLTPSYD